jgi:hypothetical protein
MKRYLSAFICVNPRFQMQDATMRHEAEFFEDQELVLIHVARRLKEALALEEAMNAAGVEYAVVPAPYTSGVLFHSQRVGAFFYVPPSFFEQARKVLRDRGLKPYEGPPAVY